MTDNENKLELAGHLTELRRRLIYCLLSIAASFCVAYYFSAELYELLTEPLRPAFPGSDKFLAFTAVTEPFFTYLKVGVVGGILLAAPVIIYQCWAFVSPGLYAGEKRWFLPSVFFSTILFTLGVIFCYTLVLPFALKYLLGYSGPELRPVLSMGLYFALTTKLLFAFGVAFQLPLVVLILSLVGVVGGRQLAGWWKYALICSVFFGAFLTPPDVVSQLLLAGPLMVLYFLGVLLALIFGKKK
ncbi:MAG: twin-arginine translocase subunit TatC [Deltaproteobacteria bacterium]|nr:twin-arginine translocase subunit TatC [Deltaproteobacteria bacterium]